MAAVLVLACSVAGICGEMDDLLSNAKTQGRPVMLEFGSKVCAPCLQMEPVLKRLVKEYPGRLDVVSVDVNAYHDFSVAHGVRVLPTQVFLDKNGKEFNRHYGYYPYEEIKEALRKAGL